MARITVSEKALSQIIDLLGDVDEQACLELRHELANELGLRRHLPRMVPNLKHVESDSAEAIEPHSRKPVRTWPETRTLERRVLQLYSRGYSAKAIQSTLLDLTNESITLGRIKRITDSTIEEREEWLSRPLEPVYPIVYLDCLYIKIRDGSPRPKAVYIALGITMEGVKDILGIWIARTEGAKLWRSALQEIQSRGVQDILVVCIDGLKGFSEAIASVFPRATVQLCLVHMIRRTMDVVVWKDRKELSIDLRQIYAAPTLEAAETALRAFERKWDPEYPTVCASWHREWHRLTPFFDFNPFVRQIIYSTNMIESFNLSIRRVTAYRMFSDDAALLNLLHVAIKSIAKHWTGPIRNWRFAKAQFQELSGR